MREIVLFKALSDEGVGKNDWNLRAAHFGIGPTEKQPGRHCCIWDGAWREKVLVACRLGDNGYANGVAENGARRFLT